MFKKFRKRKRPEFDALFFDGTHESAAQIVEYLKKEEQMLSARIQEVESAKTGGMVLHIYGPHFTLEPDHYLEKDVFLAEEDGVSHTCYTTWTGEYFDKNYEEIKS